MAVDKTLFIKQVRERESMIVAYSAATNMPFVICDQDTFDDQVWIFENEENLQAFAKEYTERKIPLRGTKILNKDFLVFFSSLYLIGVNQLVFDNGQESAPMTLELAELVNAPDYSRFKPEQRPVTNPNIELTGLYFMQEASRPVPNEQKENIAELEEELASNLVQGRYLLPMLLKPGPGTLQEKLKTKQFQPVLIKTNKGDILQPIFTDQAELQRYAKGQKLMAVTIPFPMLEKSLVKDSKGFMLNPAGFHMVLSPQLLKNLPKRFPDRVVGGTAGRDEAKKDETPTP